MTIWLFALGAILICATLGFFLGAVISLVWLIGVWISAFLAQPLGLLIQPHLEKVGIESQFWAEGLAPLIAFLLLQFVFMLIGIFPAIKVSKTVRYKFDEVAALKWRRLQRNIGLALGLVGAMCILVVVAGYVYVGGYITSQLSASTPPKGFALVSDARKDIAGTGLLDYVGGRDDKPEEFYRVVDVVALIYHNPALHHRLAGYPGFLEIAEMSEYRAIRDDSALNEMLQTQGDITQIYDNPKIQAFMSSAAVRAKLAEIDIDDLERYLHTAETEKYDERIVGRWKMDNFLSLTSFRNKLIELPTETARIARKGLLLVDITMVNTLDGDTIVKVNVPEAEIRRLAEEANVKAAAAAAARASQAAALAQAAAAQQQATQAQSERNARFADVYGDRGAANQTQAPAAAIQRRTAAAPQADPAAEVISILGELSNSVKGKWTKDQHKYSVGLGGTDMEVRVLSGDLILIDDDIRLTFYKN